MVFYQIQTKFRDELRTRFGIVRACEFIMKDAYSFDRDQEGLKKNYDLMYKAYKRIFDRCGLETVILAADSGAMGGDVSHEYMVPAPIGEDVVITCDSCGNNTVADEEYAEGKTCSKCKRGKLSSQIAIELGHIFQLGTKYSVAQGAFFLDADGKQRPIIMGCYGIGVSRVIAAIIEKHNDEKGIIWPKEVAPFDIEILPVPGADDNREIMGLTDQYDRELSGWGMDVLIDDRQESPGRKFNDADLIGIPLRVTIGRRNLAHGNVEIKIRETNETITVEKGAVTKKIMELASKTVWAAN
jgi:prolyl-tRNA synthetase